MKAGWTLEGVRGVSLSANIRSGRKVALVVASALLVVTATYVLWRAVWPSPPNLIDQCDTKEFSRNSAPIVVVGVLASDTLVFSRL